ncbi:SART-1 protein [Dipodascopsis uninucleata]
MEISESLEETNKRRLALGLRPIPVDNGSEHGKRRTDKNSNDDVQSKMDQPDESLSIEETNRLRLSLGLRPIPIESRTGSDASVQEKVKTRDDDEEAVANWRAKYEQEKKNAELEATRQRIQRAKERVERLKYLEGKSLGDDDNEDDSALAWIKKTRRNKKQVRISMADDEVEETSKVYSSADLKGLRVGHSLDEISGMDDDVILTLKDRGVLEEGEDELISEVLDAKRRAEKNIENRKKKAKYRGFEDDEDEDRGILSRYEDEDDENSKNFFNIDSEVISVGSSQAQRELKQDLKHEGSVKVSLDVNVLPTDIRESDYMPAVDPSKIKIKKPKKFKSKNSRKRTLEENNGAQIGDSDNMVVDTDVIEDDDLYLQTALARQRRLAQKKRKTQIATPEMLAQSLREQNEDFYPDNSLSGGLVIDDTSEFVDSLTSIKDEETQRPGNARIIKREIVEEHEPSVMNDDSAMDLTNTSKQGEEAAKIESDSDDVERTGLEEEPVLSQTGIGDTVAMLRSRGFLKSLEEEDKERMRIERQNRLWRVDIQKRRVQSELEAKAQREADRKSGKYDNLTHREREEAAQRENQLRQLQEAREAQRRFKDYKPEIKLEYKDEFGRSMNQKEAFKHLSHQFHGKGSGRKKTEKKLKKIEEERKKESASLFSADT